LTLDGIVYGTTVIIRFMVLLSSGLLLLNNSTTELITALVKLGLPYDIVIMVMMGIRFLPVFIEEIQDTLNYIQLRGVNLKRVYKKKVLMVYISIFYPIVYSLMVRAEKIAILMELRGFRRYDKREYYRTINFSKTDYIIMAVTAFTTVLFVISAHFVKNI